MDSSAFHARVLVGRFKFERIEVLVGVAVDVGMRPSLQRRVVFAFLDVGIGER